MLVQEFHLFMACKSNFEHSKQGEINQMLKIKVWQHSSNLLIFGDVQSQFYGLFSLV